MTSMENLKEQVFRRNSRVAFVRHNDLDGVGCEIVFKTVFEDVNIVSYSCDYNSIDECIVDLLDNNLSYTHIVIADICPSKDVMESLDLLQKMGVSVVLFDHHKTSLQYNHYSWVYVSEEKSATYLMYEYYIGRHTNVNRFLKTEFDNLNLFSLLVHFYDTWLWTIDNNICSVHLNDLFLVLGEDVFIENIMEKLKIEDVSLISNSEKILLDKLVWKERDKNFEYAEEGLVFYKQNSLKYGLIEDIGDFNMNHSLFAHHLLDKYHLDFVVLGNKKDNRVSFRSGEIDVSSIAKLYGGGGHTNAAGGNFKIFFDSFNISKEIKMPL